MTTAHVRSITDKLKNIARQKNIPHAETLTQFLIERAVARMGTNQMLIDHLVFKGGFVGLKVYGSIRYTTDLDAITYRKDRSEIIDFVKQCLEKDLGDHVWFHYESEIDLQTQGEYGGVRLSYRFGLGEIPTDKRKAQIFHFDLGSGDPVTPAPKKESTKATIGDGELIWQVYPVETIIAEKIHPLVKLGSLNSRSKDIFDLAHLLAKASPQIVQKALTATFNYRGDELPVSLATYLDGLDLSKLKRGWVSATASIPSKPDFDESFAVIVAWFTKNNL